MTAVRKEEETKEMGKIIGICISEKRGTAKHEVETAKLVEDWGIEGDAHAGHWHRQVSLLSYEKIEAFRAKGADIPLGAFGENLIVEGYDFRNLPVGTRFSCGDALLTSEALPAKQRRATCSWKSLTSSPTTSHAKMPT